LLLAAVVFFRSSGDGGGTDVAGDEVDVAMAGQPKPSQTQQTPRQAVAPFDAAMADSIVLFDGSDTSIWKSLGPFVEKDRALVSAGKGMAVSRDTYDDFELEFQWKIIPGGNSGVFYRSPVFSVIRAGTEYQLLDNAGHPNGRNPMTTAGSLYNY